MTASLFMGMLLTCCTCCAASDAAQGSADGAPALKAAATDRVERLRVKVLEVLPHDPESFTQGLEMAGDTLYEGTGLAGRSSVQAGPPGGQPTTRVSLPAPLFGEGITVLGRTLWQLTWQNGIAVERDAATLEEVRRLRYPDEGWGYASSGPGTGW